MTVTQAVVVTLGLIVAEPTLGTCHPKGAPIDQLGVAVSRQPKTTARMQIGGIVRRSVPRLDLALQPARALGPGKGG